MNFSVSSSNRLSTSPELTFGHHYYPPSDPTHYNSNSVALNPTGKREEIRRERREWGKRREKNEEKSSEKREEKKREERTEGKI